MAKITPRQMRQEIFNAFGNAKLDGRDVMSPADFPLRRAGKRNAIGFAA